MFLTVGFLKFYSSVKVSREGGTLCFTSGHSLQIFVSQWVGVVDICNLQEELTLTLAQQCRTSQINVQRIIERSGDADPVLFEALNVNDDLQRVLTKFEEMSKPTNGAEQQNPHAAEEEPAVFAHVQAMEEDDSHGGGGEEAALVRNRGSKTPATATSSSHDDDAMADLDAMIFGNKSGEQRSQKPKKQDSDDLIMF